MASSKKRINLVADETTTNQTNSTFLSEVEETSPSLVTSSSTQEETENDELIEEMNYQNTENIGMVLLTNNLVPENIRSNTTIFGVTGTLEAESSGSYSGGETLKTINNETLIGSGNIDLQTPLISGVNLKTINGNSFLGSGNIAIESESPINVQIESSSGNIFKGGILTTRLICNVYQGVQNITYKVNKFDWKKYDKNGNLDETWYNVVTRPTSGWPVDVNNEYIIENYLDINAGMVNEKAIFNCIVDIDD